MNPTIIRMGYLVMILGLVGVVIGGIFVCQALSKQFWMQDAMRQEKISLAALGITGANANMVVDSMEAAQVAGDTIRQHRRSIAPTYSDLMAGGKYDPANPNHVTYAQAMNLENYLYLAVLSFGVVLIALGCGAFMVAAGLASAQQDVS